MLALDESGENDGCVACVLCSSLFSPGTKLGQAMFGNCQERYPGIESVEWSSGSVLLREGSQLRNWSQAGFCTLWLYSGANQDSEWRAAQSTGDMGEKLKFCTGNWPRTFSS